jgi:hypothetical protein
VNIGIGSSSATPINVWVNNRATARN